MADTTKLALPLIAAGQAQKHVTVNEALSRLDALTQISLVDVDVMTPPGAVSEGDCYGVGTGASGVWTGQDATVAAFVIGGWSFLQPRSGWSAWIESVGSLARFDGVGWVVGAGALTANGAGFLHRSLEVDHDVTSGPSSTVAAFIPSNAIVYGITGRVIADIGGASSIQLGVSGSPDRYGSGIGVGQGAWMRGITGSPLAYYAAEDLIVTAVGGNFNGSGTLRLAVHFAELTLPRA